MSESIHLGREPLGNERDAVHVAVVPSVAGERLNPGDRVKIKDGKAYRCMTGQFGHGVVDPFLEAQVPVGHKFYLCLRPGTVTSLRHEWTHPDFPKHPDSVEWLTDFAATVEMPYDSLLAALTEVAAGTRDGIRLSFDTPDECWSSRDAMWRHFELATGITVPGFLRDESPFRCSC